MAAKTERELYLEKVCIQLVKALDCVKELFKETHPKTYAECNLIALEVREILEIK